MTQSAMVAQLTDDLATIRSWSQAAPGVQLAEIDTINVVLGDGANLLVAGIGAALRVDFNAYITGGYLHEFDGTSGSVTVGIEKATYTYGIAPGFASIVGSSPLSIVADRYGENVLLEGWTREIERGDVLRFSVASAISIKRVLIALRIRRLEP